MNLTIHRGTHEIGGSCVEIASGATRILVDFGMPLVAHDGTEFNSKKYKKSSIEDLINEKILPNIPGLYDDKTKAIDAIIISHPHIDHYGFAHYIGSKIPIYVGKATAEIIKLSEIFINSTKIKNPIIHLEKNIPLKIGDITITPYWNDHSAFDAYSFLIEAKGKKIFYTGDFRAHGRKAKAFYWFTHNAPKYIDYLLMEGTMIGRKASKEKTEEDLKMEMIQIFKEEKVALVYTSGQNIDRLVTIYKASRVAKKILVVDVYIANVLKALSKYARIQYPSNEYPYLQVIYAQRLSRAIANKGYKNLLYQFTKFKITREEIAANPAKYVLIVRPSLKNIIELMRLSNGNFIYSLWEGYLEKPYTKKFVEYLKSKGFKYYYIHTSGHADIFTLQKMVDIIKPKYIVPIHTFNPKDYSKIFKYPVKELADGIAENI